MVFLSRKTPGSKVPPSPMKKALRRCARLSLVDKRFEISNLDLIRDMLNIMKLAIRTIDG
jgi:hypothetical protein